MSLHIAHRRQYERLAIDVSVQLTIDEACRTQVSPMSGVTFPARLTNISGGGAHVVVATFVPRTTLIELEIPPGNELPAGRIRVRVMKVQMVDREPRYGVGLRFEDDESEVVRALQAAEAGEADA